MAEQGKKLVCFSIPCYNEVDNVVPMAEQLLELFSRDLKQYQVRIQFIDNNSNDGTQDRLRSICAQHPEVRAILNAKNFPMSSGYYGMLQAEGDCVIAIPCDFQVPLAVIPELLRRWEHGAKIVCLVKKRAEESKMLWKTRQLFYSLSERLTNEEVTRNYNGCGLYDRTFMEVCRSIDDPVVSFLQIVSTLGYDKEYLEYIHVRRKTGKSKNNFISLLNIAMNRFTNSSLIGPRIATIGGFLIGSISFFLGVLYLVLKLLFWDLFIAGIAPIMIGVFFMGAVQLFFIGLLGEYVLKANQRLMKRPLVIERERINFEPQEGLEQ